MTGAFHNFLYLVSVLSTGLLTVFSVKRDFFLCPLMVDSLHLPLFPL